MKSLGRCDLRIGPHTFSGTSFSEVQYLPEHPTLQTNVATLSHQPQYSQSYAQQQSYQDFVSSTSSTPQPSTRPLMTLEASVEVTPALIAKVNEAASTNPSLQHLLQVAAAGTASIDQLKTLGAFIQTLASQSSHSTGQLYPSLAGPSSEPEPVRKFC